MPRSIQIAVDVIPNSYAQNVPWLTPYYKINDLGKFRCNIALGTANVVEYTVDGGANYIKINSGNALIANCAYGFDLYVRAGDNLNFRSPTAGNTIVIMTRCDSIKDEG